MALENTDLQDQLAAAPPQAPTAADAEADKAATDSAAAQQLANALTPAKTPPAPFGSWGYKEKPADLNLPQPEAPYNPSAPAPGSLGYHLMKAFSTPAAKEPGGGVKALFSGVTDALLGKPLNASWKTATTDDTTQPTTAPPTGPSRAQRVINNLGASFGDLAAATEGGPEGGGIMGAARVARAGAQRTREEMNDRRLMATANAQMLHEQALVHKMGEDEINSSIATSTKQMENLTTPVPGAPTDAAGKTIATDKTSDELNQMIKSGELNPTEETVFATGRVNTGKDANGVPQFRTTYTVVKPAAEVELSPENAKYLNENLGLTGAEAYSTDPEKPQRLPGVQVNQLFQQANNARITKRAFEVKEAAEDETVRKAQTSKDAETIFKNPVVMNAINGHMTSPDDPFAVVKAYDAIMNNPKLRNDPSMPRNFSEAYIQAAGGTAVWDKKVEEYNKAQQKNTDTVDDMLNKAVSNPKEIEGHTPAFEAAMSAIISAPPGKYSDEKRKKAAEVLSVVKDVKQKEIDLDKAKAEGKKDVAIGYQGDPSASTPEAFLDSLKPNERANVKMIGEGRSGDINLAYLVRAYPGILDAVARAYPDFDKSKVTAYLGAVKDFTSKNIANQLLSGSAVLLHLQEARELNTNESHNPLSPDYTAYQSKVNTIANDLGNFYGNNTIPAIAGYKGPLESTLFGKRESAILTQAQSMTDRLTGLVKRWRNAAPSKAYESQMPWISPEGQWALSKLSPQFAQDYPELISQGTQTPRSRREQGKSNPPQFQGKIGVEAGGKTHYFNTQAEADNFKKLAGIR